MLSTVTLTDEQKQILRNTARRASRKTRSAVSVADILARLLTNSDALLEIEEAIFEASPQRAVFERQFEAQARREAMACRAFLRAEYRRLRSDGQNDPMQRACAALAKKHGWSVDSLTWDMRPPEWSHTPQDKMPAGWWYKAGRKPTRKALAWDDRSWPGQAEVITPEERERRRQAKAAAFAADVEHERRRLEAIARERGIAITDFCPEHGQRLFSCDPCIRPRWHAYPAGHSYGDKLRGAIFGEEVLYGRKAPGKILPFKRLPIRREHVAA